MKLLFFLFCLEKICVFWGGILLGKLELIQLYTPCHCYMY